MPEEKIYNEVKELFPNFTDEELQLIVDFLEYDGNLNIFDYAKYKDVKFRVMNSAQKVELALYFMKKREESEKHRIFKINDFLTLKLENNQTNIYVREKLFNQCKYLLLNIPLNDLREVNEIDSIDEAAEKLSHKMERNHKIISAQEEFIAHCSNLQAWAENDYDTRILHRNLAFPLLKQLTDKGDPAAKRVFKEEIARRFLSGHKPVMTFLAHSGYLDYLNKEEFEWMMYEIEDTSLVQFIEKIYLNRKNTDLVHRVIAENLNASDWDGLASNYAQNGQIARAIEAREKVLELEPDFPHGRLNLAILYDRNSNYSKAIESFLIILRQQPQNKVALKYLADTCYKTNYVHCAFNICTKLLDLGIIDTYIRNLLLDLITSGVKKAKTIIRDRVIKALSDNNNKIIRELLHEKFLEFFQFEELSAIYDKIDTNKQVLLRKVNHLINVKRVMDNLKKQKKLNINLEERYKDLRRLY